MKGIRSLVACWVGLVVVILVLSFGPTVVSASSTPTSFTYHAGDSFLAALNPAFAPDNATSTDTGDYVLLAGSGTFNTATKMATGSGTFEHHHADGSLVATGTWIGTGLINFVSYGPAGSSFPSGFFGGKAAIRVTITPANGGGATFQATLTVLCALGSPPAGAMEGVRLNVYDLVNFNEQTGGATVFVAAT